MSLSLSMSRSLLRSSARPLFAASRAASTTSSTATVAADKAKEAAGTVQDKASSGAEAAKGYMDKAAQSGSAVIGGISERASGLLGAYREPIVYNLQVVREIGKQVYIAEKLQPPTNPQVIREAYQDFYSKASSGSWWRSILESGEWKRIALYAAEAYGIFTIGEMIGRRHVVGYKVEH